MAWHCGKAMDAPWIPHGREDTIHVEMMKSLHQGWEDGPNRQVLIRSREVREARISSRLRMRTVTCGDHVGTVRCCEQIECFHTLYWIFKKLMFHIHHDSDSDVFKPETSNGCVIWGHGAIAEETLWNWEGHSLRGTSLWAARRPLNWVHVWSFARKRIMCPKLPSTQRRQLVSPWWVRNKSQWAYW